MVTDDIVLILVSFVVLNLCHDTNIVSYIFIANFSFEVTVQ
jgi:hypothetical protein